MNKKYLKKSDLVLFLNMEEHVLEIDEDNVTLP